ncbi:restriction endonuclease subunit S [Psychrobacter faecalis]|jgi:type I restriction enzyme S subunit|uniref:restriction endonuclease subunit S n=1 Tax=Psychrobacter faecalis TaxID=180588 RepID=UPI0028AFAD48|nr:restriction endonuclease subunit S [Psychrobacter faecalis]
MASDWKEVILDDVLMMSKAKIDSKDIDIESYVSTDNMLPDFGGVTAAEKLPSASKFTAYKAEDILFSNIRTYFRKLWIANKDGGCSNDVIVFKAREGINPSFGFYSLMNEEFIQYTVQTSKGTKMPRGDKEAMKIYPLSLPPLSEQKAIAHILGSLDDKIELNRQMNETLEAMAQALFKSWFVDFDPVIDNALAAGNAIPDELLERAEQRQAIEKKDNSDIQNLFPNAFEFTEEMGWIPKGWGVSKLGEYIEVKRGGSPRPIHDYLVPKGLPWVKISDATASNSRFLVETKQFIKPEGLNKTTLLKKGSLILSNSATPGLPKFLDLDACIHDGWLHFPKKKIFTDNYLYQLFLVVRQELLMQGNGSVFTNLKTDILKNHMVVVPNIDVLNYFDNWINSFHNKIHAVQIDVDNLSRIRDTLLPKLMSGELRISDAAELVEEVV